MLCDFSGGHGLKAMLRRRFRSPQPPASITSHTWRICFFHECLICSHMPSILTPSQGKIGLIQKQQGKERGSRSRASGDGQISSLCSKEVELHKKEVFLGQPDANLCSQRSWFPVTQAEETLPPHSQLLDGLRATTSLEGAALADLQDAS